MDAEPNGQLIWPVGVDLTHRLYVAAIGMLWRLTAPRAMTGLTSPSQVLHGQAPGYPEDLISDAHGSWVSGTGGVWLYGESNVPTLVKAGPADAQVYPAGRCS